MSIINNMLRDLDQRQGREPGQAQSGEALRSVPPASAFKVGAPARWMIGGILATGALAAWWMQQQVGTAAAVAVAPAPVPAPAPILAAPPVVDAPAQRAGERPPAHTPTESASLDIKPQATPAAERKVAEPRLPEAKPSQATALPAPTVTRPAQPVAPPIAVAAVDPARTGSPVAAPSSRALMPLQRGEGKVYTPGQAAAKMVSEAAALQSQGRTPEARALLEKVLSVQPADIQARQMLVQMCIDAGQWEEAQSLLTEGQRLHPDQLGFVQTLARLRAERGDVPAAIALLENARHRRDDAGTRALLGALLLRQERYSESLQHYLAALRSEPGNGSWLIGAGLGLEATGHAVDAAEAYRRAALAPGLTPELAAFLQDKLERAAPRAPRP